jgi:hypothetical protein
MVNKTQEEDRPTMSTAVPTHARPARAAARADRLHPRVVLALRGAAVVAGLAGALAGLFFAGLFALLSDCSGDAAGMCTNFAGLVPVLEWSIVVTAFAAPLAGGIANCARRQWMWLPAGLVTAAAMVSLAMLVSSGQTPLLS